MGVSIDDSKTSPVGAAQVDISAPYSSMLPLLLLLLAGHGRVDR
jgi:hypothetical protein